MNPRGDERAECAANIYQGVVDGIADGPNVGTGRASGRADNARLNQGDPKSGKNQNDANKKAKWNGVADGREPRGADGPKREVRGRKN